MIVVTCDGQSLRDVRICLTKDGRARSCGENEHRGMCRTDQMRCCPCVRKSGSNRRSIPKPNANPARAAAHRKPERAVLRRPAPQQNLWRSARARSPCRLAAAGPLRTLSCDSSRKRGSARCGRNVERRALSRDLGACGREASPPPSHAGGATHRGCRVAASAFSPARSSASPSGSGGSSPLSSLGTRQLPAAKHGRSPRHAGSLPTIYLVDPVNCSALQLNRETNRTELRPCPSSGLALRLDPETERESLAEVGDPRSRRRVTRRIDEFQRIKSGDLARSLGAPRRGCQRNVAEVRLAGAQSQRRRIDAPAVARAA